MSYHLFYMHPTYRSIHFYSLFLYSKYGSSGVISQYLAYSSCPTVASVIPQGNTIIKKVMIGGYPTQPLCCAIIIHVHHLYHLGENSILIFCPFQYISLLRLGVEVGNLTKKVWLIVFAVSKVATVRTIEPRKNRTYYRLQLYQKPTYTTKVEGKHDAPHPCQDL